MDRAGARRSLLYHNSGRIKRSSRQFAWADAGTAFQRVRVWMRTPLANVWEHAPAMVLGLLVDRKETAESGFAKSPGIVEALMAIQALDRSHLLVG